MDGSVHVYDKHTDVKTVREIPHSTKNKENKRLVYNWLENLPVHLFRMKFVIILAVSSVVSGRRC